MEWLEKEAVVFPSGKFARKLDCYEAFDLVSNMPDRDNYMVEYRELYSNAPKNLGFNEYCDLREESTTILITCINKIWKYNQSAFKDNPFPYNRVWEILSCS